jgi:5-methyltetrahydrofolate--homocysteine methyltransferase
LLSKELKPEFVRKTREEYAKIRERTSNRKTNIEYLSYQQALDNRLQLDWSTYQPPVPSFTGSRMIEKVDLKEVRNFIDWTPLLYRLEPGGPSTRAFSRTKWSAKPRKPCLTKPR